MGPNDQVTIRQVIDTCADPDAVSQSLAAKLSDRPDEIMWMRTTVLLDWRDRLRVLLGASLAIESCTTLANVPQGTVGRCHTTSETRTVPPAWWPRWWRLRRLFRRDLDNGCATTSDREVSK